MSGNHWILVGLLVISINATAEVYRWVDNSGKVHYTDKKPAPTAENITKKVSKQNVDSSSGELRKVEQIHNRNAARQQEHPHTRAQTNAQQQRQSECSAAQQRLNKISGRVIFLDDDGKVVTVNEQERQTMVAELKQEIQTNCSQ